MKHILFLLFCSLLLAGKVEARVRNRQNEEQPRQQQRQQPEQTGSARTKGQNKQPAAAAKLEELSIEEWKKVQQYIEERKAPDELEDTKESYTSLRVIGKTAKELPKFEKLYLRCGASERENCIILYASYNLNYPKGLERLIKIISDSDFRGHVYYRIGGWPNAADGGLDYIDTPYGFKFCAFKEAQKEEYKRVLWMDASIIPVASLNAVFNNMIRKQGYFVQANNHNVGEYMNERCAKAFGITLQDTDNMLSCSAAVIGIDFTHEKGKEFFAAWEAMLKKPEASYSARSDQNLISIVLHQLGMTSFAPARTMATSLRKVKWDTLFVTDRGFVKSE